MLKLFRKIWEVLAENWILHTLCTLTSRGISNVKITIYSLLNPGSDIQIGFWKSLVVNYGSPSMNIDITGALFKLSLSILITNFSM